MQNRFKAILCEEDPYFLELVRYIHLNPVRAGIVKTLDALARYPWTGHAALMGTPRLDWQAVDDVLNRFGSTVTSARVLRNLSPIAGARGHRPDLEGGGLLNSLGGISGALRAAAAVNVKLMTPESWAAETSSKKFSKCPKKPMNSVTPSFDPGSRCKPFRVGRSSLGVDSERLLQQDRRQPVAKARALFVYATTELLGRRSEELAKLLNMSSGSISEARQRGRGLSKEYEFLERLRRDAPIR